MKNDLINKLKLIEKELVDSSSWKPYKIGDLFEIKRGKSSKKPSLKGDVPYVSASSGNNGITAYVAFNEKKISEGNVITVANNGSVGETFYQKNIFIGSSDITILKNEKLNSNVSLFLIPLLKRIGCKYSYGNKFSMKKMEEEILFLPSIVENGVLVPDWVYMENYIENTNKSLSNNYIENIKNIKKEEMNISEWKEFNIGDLFEKITLKSNKNGFNKRKDISMIKTLEFNLPLVNAKLGNNGIMYYGRDKDFDNIELSIGVVSDGVVSSGSIYPQPQRTGVLYNAYLIKSIHPINKSILFFLSIVLNKHIKPLFSYENKATWERVKKEKIFLPSILKDDEWTPDWVYMESYIQNLEEALNEK